MKKRLKSFAITSASVLGTAFVAVVLTPEWSSFLQYAHDKIASWGVPVAILAVLGVFVSEVWKQILNYRTVKKAVKSGATASSYSFEDSSNELY